MTKVVIDTNLLINGSSDENNLGNRILDEVLSGKIEAYANRSTLKENKLISRQNVTDEDYRQKLERFFVAVRPVDFLSKRLDVVEDSEDNKLVESAVAAGADYLITADWHLLKLEKYGHTEIVTPEQFWNRKRDESGVGWMEWIKDFIG